MNVKSALYVLLCKSHCRIVLFANGAVELMFSDKSTHAPLTWWVANDTRVIMFGMAARYSDAGAGPYLSSKAAAFSAYEPFEIVVNGRGSGIRPDWFALAAGVQPRKPYAVQSLAIGCVARAMLVWIKERSDFGTSVHCNAGPAKVSV
jgi:hypothetical protein